MKLSPNEKLFTLNYNFLQRWPDSALYKSFRELLIIYCDLIKERDKDSSNTATLVHEGYELICQLILEANAPLSTYCNGRNSSLNHYRLKIQSLLFDLKKNRRDWLQSVSSLLGMLMHFTVDKRKLSFLVNNRRPHKLCSTYPNSPSVARFMGDIMMKHLLKAPIPTICHRSIDAERYAENAVYFKVLDPSMESGQLLLEVASASIRMIQSKHLPQSKTAQYLTRAILKKICRDCLWGIDRSGQALVAVQSIFSLLGAEFGIQQLAITNLLTADALTLTDNKHLPTFEGLINNPPWGEILDYADKKRLRRQFPTLQYWTDTYIAFTELTLRFLKPSGYFVLILPSQVIATRNAARLRKLLISQTSLKQMILLPRSAFADATVRGLMLIGQGQTRRSVANCKIMVFPIVKKLTTEHPVQSRIVSAAALCSTGAESWMPLFNNYTKPRAKTICLEQLATITAGVKLYCYGSGNPHQTIQIVRRQPYTFQTAIPDTIPAIRGRDVHDFKLGAPRRFIKFGEWLAWIGIQSTIRHLDRIFVRELCRRDGKITAAVVRKSYIPLQGVLTVIPKMVGIYPLVCILNSRSAAEYVRSYTASFSKVDFQKMTVGELRSLPIPIAAIKPMYRSALGIDKATDTEIAFCKQLTALARRLLQPTLSGNETQEHYSKIDEIVFAMYNLTNNKMR